MDEIIETNYYSFKEVLGHVGIQYDNNGQWMINLYKLFDMEAPDAKDFYKTLGIYLSDPRISICNDLDLADDKLLWIINKNDMVIEDYLAYFKAITQEIDSLKSKSITKFNDTPTEEGDYTADQYTSTITQSENIVDYDINTKINIASKRLRHFKEAYCNEFKGLVTWIN